MNRFFLLIRVEEINCLHLKIYLFSEDTKTALVSPGSLFFFIFFLIEFAALCNGGSHESWEIEKKTAASIRIWMCVILQSEASQSVGSEWSVIQAGGEHPNRRMLFSFSVLVAGSASWLAEDTRDPLSAGGCLASAVPTRHTNTKPVGKASSVRPSLTSTSYQITYECFYL